METVVYLVSVMTNATGVNYTFQLSHSLLGERRGGMGKGGDIVQQERHQSMCKGKKIVPAEQFDFNCVLT